MTIKLFTEKALFPMNYYYDGTEAYFNDMLKCIIVQGETLNYGTSNEICKTMKRCKKDYTKLRSYEVQVDAYRKAGICNDLVVQYNNLVRTFKSIRDLYSLLEPHLVEKPKKEPESTEQPNIDNPF